jgi:hypothetical protein
MFITTEVSDKTMKDQIGNFTGTPLNYAANLTKSQDIGDLWVFKNGVKGTGLMGIQPNVFNSIPGDPKYAPLWRVNLVEWKTTGSANASTATPTILGSDDAIAAAASKGQIKITATSVVVNCPIVQWGATKTTQYLQVIYEYHHDVYYGTIATGSLSTSSSQYFSLNNKLIKSQAILLYALL